MYRKHQHHHRHERFVGAGATVATPDGELLRSLRFRRFRRLFHNLFHRRFRSTPANSSFLEKHNHQQRREHQHRRFRIKHQRIGDFDQLVGDDRADRKTKIRGPRLQRIRALLLAERHHVGNVGRDRGRWHGGNRAVNQQRNRHNPWIADKRQQHQHHGGTEVADDDHRRPAEPIGQRTPVQAAENAAEAIHGDDRAGNARTHVHVGHEIHGKKRGDETAHPQNKQRDPQAPEHDGQSEKLSLLFHSFHHTWPTACSRAAFLKRFSRGTFPGVLGQ